MGAVQRVRRSLLTMLTSRPDQLGQAFSPANFSEVQNSPHTCAALANRVDGEIERIVFERRGHRRGRTASEQQLRRLPDLCAAAISEPPSQISSSARRRRSDSAPFTGELLAALEEVCRLTVSFARTTDSLAKPSNSFTRCGF